MGFLLKIAKIAVEAPLKTLLSYIIPEELQFIEIGSIVSVPLGRRQARGVVFEINTTVSEKIEKDDNSFQLKEVSGIDQEYSAAMIKNYLPWISWIAEYYFYPIGLVASLLFPPLEKKAKKTSRKKSAIPLVEKEIPFKMNPEQETIYQAISQNMNFSVHLLYGITGSGKTEVYLQLFDKIMQEGRKGLFLLPEISLTPQLVSRFAKRFGDKLSLIHSQLTDRERTQFWWDIVEGDKSILIGARSAMFCPIPNLGLIVVDEEHEASFKQDEKLKYHGRDTAIMLGKFLNCPVILGSATPSFESWQNGLQHKFQIHRLTKRVGTAVLPDVEVVDLKISKDRSKELGFPFWLSESLFNEMQIHLEEGSQIALFLNRRGMSQTVICPACGHTKECPNCDIKLTLHAHNHLTCHYCDYHESFKKKCSDCKEGEMEPLGVGTEAVEIEIKKQFPKARIARVDRDEIQNRLDMESIIEKMENHEIDILIGTQMISKGLDFPKLKLVGLLLADIGFNMPDFRSGEKSFQLLTQMSGRSGRHVKENEKPGKVILQTFNPENESIQFALQANYEGYAEYDLNNRKMLDYPPFGKIISFRIQSKHLDQAQQIAKKLAHRSFTLKDSNPKYEPIEILGPAESPIFKIRGDFRYQLLVKSKEKNLINQFVRQLLHDEKWVPSTTRIIIDVDPQNLL
ncbi:MAG: primosomal protein N' [Bdellovibrionaceae bacterium]|nr:primosomal protein N' [Pseudobdellovibrionaceae bacterium]